MKTRHVASKGNQGAGWMGTGLVLLASVWLLAAGCAAGGVGAGRGEAGAQAAAASPAWTQHAVQLAAVGYALSGEGVTEGAWQGTGFWVAPGLIATNAHVVSRALAMQASTDDGTIYPIEGLVALWPERDLALVRTINRRAGTPVVLALRPSDVRSLRDVPVRVTANLHGQLTLNRGRIAAVVASGSGHDLLHSADIGSGASGGPVYDDRTGQVVAVSYAVRQNPYRGVAVASWELAALVAQAAGKAAVPLEQVFNFSGNFEHALVPLNRGRICAKPGELTALKANVQGVTDVAVVVSPANPSARYTMAVATDGPDKPSISQGTGQTNWIGTLQAPLAGSPMAVVVSPASTERRPQCFDTAIVRVDWSARLRTLQTHRAAARVALVD